MRSRFIRPFLLAIAVLFLSSASFAQIGVAITIAPPALPVYEQPVCPGDGYIWTPGYWAWGDDGYYWVPGTWIEARKSVSSGRLATGAGVAAVLFGMTAIGVRP